MPLLNNIILNIILIFYACSDYSLIINSDSELINLKKSIVEKDRIIDNLQKQTANKELIIMIAVILVFVVILLIVFNKISIIKKHKKIIGWQVDWAEEQWNVSNEQREITEIQKKIIEQKQIQILDSINYARRIQQSILPAEETLKQFLPNLFVIYKPKDIVSGDFYWYSKINSESIIVVADCTGHGVPGAFLSMVGSTLLNEIVNHKNITSTTQILKMLSIGLKSILATKEREHSFDEGMDVSICKINHQTNIAEFAGVNQSIYVLSNNILNKVTPQINSIYGIFELNDNTVVEQKIIEIETNATIFMTTDGYADQIGGRFNKKINSKGFENLLQSIGGLNIESQKIEIQNYFELWRGNSVQIDDVLVMGIKA